MSIHICELTNFVLPLWLKLSMSIALLSKKDGSKFGNGFGNLIKLYRNANAFLGTSDLSLILSGL